jgi:hypothetical protein
MKPILIFFAVILSVTITNAQTTSWAYDIGDSSDITESTAICTDNNSNVYLAAWYRTNLSMCAGALPPVIPPHGPGANINQVIAKYDSAGHCKWVVTGIDLSCYQSNGNQISAIKYDGDNFSSGAPSSIGNIYVAGQATDSLVYGTDTIRNMAFPWLPCNLGYVLKLDTAGHMQWTRTITGSRNASITVAAMEVINGHVYVAGWYTDTMRIDTCILRSYNWWTFRGYIAKINSAGRCEWLKNVSDTGLINSMDAMTTDGKDLYVLGSISGMAVFGATDTVHSSGPYSSFVSKYDTSGNFKWIYGGSQVGGYLFYDKARYDHAGHIYISGIYRDSIRFGAAALITTDTVSVCVARLDTAGNFNWLYGTGFKCGYLGNTAITADDSGFYLYTNFRGTAHVGSSTYTDPGGYMSGEFLLARYDTSRSVVWSKSFGGPRENWSADITAYEGSVYYTGVTYNSFTIDGFPIVNHGVADVLLARMAVPYAPVPLGTPLVATAGATIYPNPTTGIVNINSHTAYAIEKVYSLTGQMVLEQMRTGTTASIDLSALAPGMYFLKDISPLGVITFKVVKE